HLIIPRKPARTVRRELYIIRRIRIHEISRSQRERFHIHVAKFPLPKYLTVICKIARVVDCFVSAERHIEIATLVETTQAIEARAVEIVEQLRAFLRVSFAASNQTIEALALAIEKFLFVTHAHAHPQTILHVMIEVDQVRIDVVEQCLLRLQAQHYGQSTAEWLDVSTPRVMLPDRFET